MNLSEIYKKSWNVAIKHKALWVIGAVVALFSGGYSSNFNSFSGSSNDFPFSKEGLSKEVSSDVDPLLDYIGSIFSAIPISTWVFLGLALLVSILIAIAVGIVAKSWAEGALVGGIEEALDGKEPTLKSSSHHGLKNLRALIWLNLVPGLLLFLIILAGILLGVLFTIILPVLGYILIALIILAGILGFLVIFIAQIWAVRIAVVEGKSGKEALFTGLKFAKGNIWNMLGLGCVNCLTSCLVGCASLLIIAPFAGVGIALLLGTGVLTGVPSGLSGINFGVFPLVLAVLILLFIVFGVFMTLVNAIFTVFKYSTWNVLYRQLKGSQESPEVVKSEEVING